MSDQNNNKALSIQVDVIIPVHNAAATIEETVQSAMYQLIPTYLSSNIQNYSLLINVCCYDDGSTDASWDLLCKLQQDYKNDGPPAEPNSIPSKLLIGMNPDGVGRGAGYARNRAAELPKHHQRRKDDSKSLEENNNDIAERFLCLLDSDDTMCTSRIAEQVHGMMSLSKKEREKTLMGCKVKRDPPDSTWHYIQWANSLSDDRLYLERFREVTVLQPTWMICRSRFEFLSGYVEASKPKEPDILTRLANNNKQSALTNEAESSDDKGPSTTLLPLIHPAFDTPVTLRLAEDLRFFHSHLYANGLLKLHRPIHDPNLALVTYRHRQNESQSYQTSRKLLLHLRALAFERCVLQVRKTSSNITPWTENNGRFVVWGAGRDGKDFVKALSDGSRKRIYCFVDVDSKKIRHGFYVNKELGLRIPIVHFSRLAKDQKVQDQLLHDDAGFGKIDKSKAQEEQQPVLKKPRLQEEAVALIPQVAKIIDLSLLTKLPVVVCVAMYRTNGALERNTKSVGRTEGIDLWHFS